MVFSSIMFLFIFLPAVLLGYYVFPDVRIKNIILLLASLFFYYWGAGNYIVIILISVCINYLTGLAIAYIAKSKIFVFLGLFSNLGLLFYFKYADFVIEQCNMLSKKNLPLLNNILPIGISFFTFQGLSYMLDLYNGRIEVQKNPINIALYITMFPQLIAGPIVRYSDIFDSLTIRTYSVDKFADGICRFSIGLAKKVIIADSVGLVADQIFNVSYSEHAALTCWIGIVCYTFQIYFDFMGYSDMAIGLGKMFGFDFPENFNLPYTSKSIQEFWRRWHMTLGEFFRDYVYIPLGGGKRNVYRNLWIVFFLTGLWHGAAWNFIIWGLWYGFWIMVERIINSKSDWLQKTNSVIRNVFTMTIVMIGWIIFRSENIQYAWGYLCRMLGVKNKTAVYLEAGFYMNRYIIFIIAICFLQSLGISRLIVNRIRHVKKYMMIKSIFISFLFLLDVIFVMNSKYSPFLYFQF